MNSSTPASFLRAAALAALVLLSGCAFTHVRGKNGGSLTRLSIGTSQQVGHVKAALGEAETTLDVGSLTMDQAKVAAKAIDAGARIVPLVAP